MADEVQVLEGRSGGVQDDIAAIWEEHDEMGLLYSKPNFWKHRLGCLKLSIPVVKRTV